MTTTFSLTTLGRCVIVVAFFGLIFGLAACGNGSDKAETPQGSDDHVVIDPVADDPRIAAIAVAINRFQWTPATQEGVWDLPSRVVANNLTGELKDKAQRPSGSGKDDTPAQWAGWAQAGVFVRAIVTDPVVSGEANQRTVTVTVRQDLEYPDNSGSTWKTRVVDVHLTVSDGRWKADQIKEVSSR